MMKNLCRDIADIAGSVAERIRKTDLSPAKAQTRRFGFLCISVLLALNIVTAMMPFTPSAVAETQAALPEDAISVNTFEGLRDALATPSAEHGEGSDDGNGGETVINIVLTDDITCTGNLYPLTGRTYNIYGQGHTLSRASSFTMGPGGSDDPLGSMLIVGGTAVVTVDNVIFDSCGILTDQSPIVVISESGALNLRNGSKLCHGCSKTGSGAVYMTGGTLDGGLSETAATEADGTDDACVILGCSGQNGGGIFMTGGTVSNIFVSHCAGKNGGGIYISGGSLSNCIVDYCEASSMGGGIMATGGSMNNIYVRYCAAAEYGGGIAVFRNNGVSMGDNISVTECDELPDADGNMPGNLLGESIYIHGGPDYGYSHIDFSSSSPATVSVPDCYIQTVYSGGKYQNNQLADQNNIITYSPLSENALFNGAVKTTEKELKLGDREFAGLFEPAADVTLEDPLFYTIHLTDGATHQPASGASAGTALSSSPGTSTDSPYCNKKFMLLLYELSEDDAIVLDETAVRADPCGNIDLLIGFAAEESQKIAAVLYSYPDCCKIGSKTYPALEDAVYDAKPGDIITLLRDTEVSHTLDINSNKNNLIFDGGSDHYSIYRGDDFKDAIFNIGSNINTTLKNINLSGKTYDMRITGHGYEAYNEVTSPLISCSGVLNLDNCGLYDNNNIGTSSDKDAVPGGGVYLNGGKLIAVNDSVIMNNYADNGGGIYTSKSRTGTNAPLLEISGVKITGNYAENGGGIYATEDAILRDITVQENYAGGKGGGVYTVRNTSASGLLLINNNHSGYGTSWGMSDYYLARYTNCMNINSPLDPSSIIGVLNFKKNVVVAKADGINVTSLQGLDKCFFPDVDFNEFPLKSSYRFETDNTSGQNIYCRSLFENTELYEVYAGTFDDSGMIAPNNQMFLHADSHDFTITPDKGYIIDYVCVHPDNVDTVDIYNQDKPVTGNEYGSIKITDGVGVLTCDIKSDISIYAGFRKAEGEFTLTASESGGNDACKASVPDSRIVTGGTGTVVFDTGKDNLAYALTDILVDNTSIKNDRSRKKISDYIDDISINSDNSIKYTYKVHDVRSNKKVEGIFEEVYKQRTISDPDNKINVSGSYIGKDADMKVVRLPSSDKSCKLVKNNLPDNYMLAKTGTGEYDIALYDISLVSDTLDNPFRSNLSLKLYAGKEHTGQEAFAYHVTDADKGELDKSLKGTVDSDGYFTVTTDSLSPYAIVVPKASGDTPTTTSSSTTSTITTTTTSTTSSTSTTTSSTTTTTNTTSSSTISTTTTSRTTLQAGATPTSTTVNNSVTVQNTTGTPHTGDKLPPFVIPLLIGSAVIVIVSGVSLSASRKKNNKK